MKEVTLRDLQKAILEIDHKNNSIDKYFYKLSEEVGELASSLRKEKRFETEGCIKGTVEEELWDVLYYTICLANMMGIDLENVGRLKEELNAQKYGRKSIFESI